MKNTGIFDIYNYRLEGKVKLNKIEQTENNNIQ